MTNVILKEEILKEEQLEQVAGGTNQELASLADAIFRNSYLSDLADFRISARGEKLADSVEKILKVIGIDADINIGFYGFEGKPNEYKNEKTGEYLTHDQVLNRIRKYNG